MSSVRYRALNNPYLRDTAVAILFGALSFTLSKVQFQIPQFAGNSNLQEIPLLIGLFHLRKPVFILVLTLFTITGTHPEIPYLLPYFVHLIPLAIGWVAFKQIEKKVSSDILSGVAWAVFTIAYYFVFLLPLVVLAFQWVALTDQKSFLESYISIVPSVRFEVITTSLVTGLYLTQLQIRKSLQYNNENLEQIVNTRTLELTHANNQLHVLNDTLEEMVRERTDKINEQLKQLTKYANMNSHEVRAPLARMLGLMQLLQYANNDEQVKALLEKLFASSTELDEVIKRMNRLLEHEIHINIE